MQVPGGFRLQVPGTTDQLWIAMQRDEQLRKLTPYCFKHDDLHRGAAKHRLDRLPVRTLPFLQFSLN